MTTDQVVLKPNERWVTCAMDLEPTVGQYRHIITRGGITTACGATGMPESVWRGNSKKPRCKPCIAAHKQGR